MGAAGFRLGLAGGPLLVIGLVLLARWFRVVLTDPLWVVMALLPVLLAAPFLLWAERRRDVAGFMLGALVGVVAVALFVVGAISLLAWMLSDPGPR